MTSAYPDIEGQLYTSGAPDAAYTEAEARQRAADRREVSAAASAAGAAALVDAKAYTDGKVAGMEPRVTAAERSAADAAGSAAQAEQTATDLVPRVEQIETMAGLAPGEVTDAQTANLITQPDTSTRAALKAAIVTNPEIVLTVAPGGDAAVSLNAAIDSLPSTGGTIRLRQGNYAYSSGAIANIDKPLKLIGEGLVRITSAGNFFSLAADDVLMENITFIGSNTGFMRPGTDGGNHSRFTMQNCKLENLSLHLTKRGRTQTTDGTIRQDGVGLESGVRIVGCELTGFTGPYAILVAGPRDTVIDSNYIHDVGTDALQGDAIKVSDDSTGTRIVNNTIENCTRDGVDLYSGSASYVAGNVIRNAGAKGIDQKWQTTDSYETGRDIVIGNRVIGSSDMAFSIKAFDCLVSNNMAQNSGGHAFFIAGDGGTGLNTTPRVTVMGNSALNTTGDGFSIQAATQLSIIGNTAEGSTHNGMTLGNASSRCVVMGNVLVNNGGQDLALSTGPSSHFLAGNIMDGNNGGMILPNNQIQYVYKTDGSRVQWFNMLADGNAHFGHVGIPTLSVLAGTRVNVHGELRAVNDLWHSGSKVGFYGAPTVAKQTGVPVTAEGVHAALVNLGLISG